MQVTEADVQSVSSTPLLCTLWRFHFCRLAVGLNQSHFGVVPLSAMVLGRIVTTSRFAAMPLRRPMGTLSQKLAVRTPTFGSRGAAAVSAPVPLSTRMDGLMAKVTIALIVYFVPQDLVFLGGAFWIWHGRSASAVPTAVHEDAAAAIDEFKQKKGLDTVNVEEGRSTWRVSL